MEIAGEYKEQVNGFADLTVVLVISVLLIYVALVVQFKSAIKPVLVFAAIPYGMTGAVASLWLMGAPFGFMAFLGVVSLVGVIVSHIIVLFDFIEERREHGAPLEQALLDAGIQRLRPVMITVAATVLALFPLATHGGPLWEPLLISLLLEEAMPHLAGQIWSWVNNQNLTAPVSDYLFHAAKRIALFGDLDLIPRGVLAGYLQSLADGLVPLAPEGEREMLRQNLERLIQAAPSAATKAPMAVLQRPAAGEAAPSDAPLTRVVRRLSLLLEHLRPAVRVRCVRAPGAARPS